MGQTLPALVLRSRRCNIYVSKTVEWKGLVEYAWPILDIRRELPKLIHQEVLLGVRAEPSDGVQKIWVERYMCPNPHGLLKLVSSRLSPYNAKQGTM